MSLKLHKIGIFKLFGDCEVFELRFLFLTFLILYNKMKLGDFAFILRYFKIKISNFKIIFHIIFYTWKK